MLLVLSLSKGELVQGLQGPPGQERLGLGMQQVGGRGSDTTATAREATFSEEGGPGSWDLGPLPPRAGGPYNVVVASLPFSLDRCYHEGRHLRAVGSHLRR